ncbi:hypothetical protein ACE193_11370 [Bernardetia sp. OM2101]|uniref:hypothetical protein n=1 Tax=Bernardetia sp. OM2101 TaxID=3344876 RepID=UPI0035CF4EA1
MSKSKIFFIVLSVLLLIGGSLYGYEYFTNKSIIEKADTLYQKGKFDEALAVYKTTKNGVFDTHNYEAWSGEHDIERIKKDIIPILERAKKNIKGNNTDSLLVAFKSLKNISEGYRSHGIEPISLNKEITQNRQLAKDKILLLAKKTETQNPAEAIKLYSVFDYNEDNYKTCQTKINTLYKPAILQKYNEKDYTEALVLYNKMDIADKERYKSDLKEPINHSRLEAAKKYEKFALLTYMNGEMQDVERVTKLLLEVDSTSMYAPAAKTELENLNQEVAYSMATEEYKAGNLDESLHFFAQIPPKSPHYEDSKSKITEISSKLEKEHNDSYLAKKRTEAYAEIKKQLSPYLNNKTTYSVILADAMDISDKKLKYNIIYQDKSVPTTKTTGFMKVSDSTYNFFLDDVGMEILSNKGQQITQAGYSNYVGNTQYGTWRENDEGSFWEFYGKYALLSTLFNSNRIYRDDYSTYNRYYRTSSRPYYGSVYVPLKSAVRQTPRFQQTVNNRSQKSWFYAKSAPSRSSTKSSNTASTNSKSWYYGRQPMKRSSYTSKSTAANRSSYGRSSYSSSSSGSSYSSRSSGSSSSNKGYKSSSSSKSSSSGYRSSSSSSSSSRTTRSSSSSSRSRSSSSGGK